MQMFYLKFVAYFLSMIALVSLLFAIPGCKLLEEHGAAVQLIASQASARYIESKPAADRPAVAARVVSIANAVKKAATDDTSTIVELSNLAVSLLPTNLSPADRALAVELIAVLAQELKAKIGSGDLKPDDKVRVGLVLDAVILGASGYAP